MTKLIITKKYKKGYKFIYEREPHAITGFWEPGGKYVAEQINSYDIGDGIRPIMQHVLSTEEIDTCVPITD